MINKTFNLESDFKAKSEDGSSTITIEGYANTTDKDRQGDIVLAEAWTKGGLSNYYNNPIVLAYHDRTRPIGSVTSLSVENDGLKVVAEISKAAGDIYEYIKDGVLKTFSVGFGVKDADYDPKSDLFVVKDLELFEISVVSIPANASSTFSVSKSFEGNEGEYMTFKKQFENDEEVKEETSEAKFDSEQLVNTIIESVDKKLKDSESTIKEMLKESKEMSKENEKATEVVEKDTTVVTPSADLSGVEKLLAEFQKRMDEKDATLEKALSGLRSEVAEKSAEIESLTKTKMEFTDKSYDVSTDEQDTAVFISKLMGKGINETDFAKRYVEKAGAHVTNMTADWEKEFSKRIENDIRQRLVIEPMFKTIKMNAAAMAIPVNPDAGTGNWVPVGDFGADTSSGTAKTHTVSDTLLTAHKLAAKEYIGYEEEEDAIIPLVPIIRDAVVRRMARSSDIALLRGTAVAASQATHDPIAGLTKIASTAGGAQLVTNPVGTTVTADILQTVRRGLGVWGLNPSEVVYIVSEEVYYDLLEDPDFRTVDMVGDKATILKGQVGFMNGSRIVVSGEFEAKADTKYAAVAVNASNFLVGNLRNLMVERERLIVAQQNVIVTTRRMAFLDLITGKGVSALKWVA